MQIIEDSGYNIDVLANMQYDYRKDLPVYVQNYKVQHYPILSQTCSHFSVQTTPDQFHWFKEFTKPALNLFVFFSLYQSQISH